MIPRADIVAWRENAPWATDAQVEQDLILSRALVEIYQQEFLSKAILFRGGTALHKLYFNPSARYSEDIDLVQTTPGPIGPIIDSIRDTLDPWLGEPRRKLGEGRATLYYRFETTNEPVTNMRLKVEINTREHFTVLPSNVKRLSVACRWYSGSADIQTYAQNELLGTKFRALFQRKKGRDLFDLFCALKNGDTNASEIVMCFQKYMQHEDKHITRAMFEENLLLKLKSPAFHSDMQPLLPRGVDYDAQLAGEQVMLQLLALLPGDSWKGTA